MNKTGLVSVTFRSLSVETVINLAKQAGLDGIEWGGDVHVPPGEYERAKEVGELTKAAGLEVAAYGSYYKVGEENGASFETILKTAVLLGAPAIRVWAGGKGSDSATQAYRAQVVADAKRIAQLAEKSSVEIHVEYHGGTLTDTPESAVQFIQDVEDANIFLYWQPSVGETVENRLDSIQKVAPWLANVHVFYWEQLERLPLKEGKNQWEQYIERTHHIEEEKQQDRYFMLEFVKDEDEHQFFEDTRVLKEIVK